MLTDTEQSSVTSTRDEEERATSTGPTVCVALLQVVHQDRGELSRRINLVKDTAQSPNAIMERSNQTEGKGDASLTSFCHHSLNQIE